MRMLAAGLRGLGAVLLCLVVLLSGGWSLRPRPQEPLVTNNSPATSGRLREVSPPKGSQALRLRLAEHQPRLRILAPADDTVLPLAPWSLELALEDWPLADAGSLGLGAHLVVQLDDQEPLRLGPDVAKAPLTKDSRLSLTMAPLSPGSHRLTVYAARPWGEAVKDPGAAVQIRLHGLAANPLSQPRRGTPQLVSSTPSDLIHHEPVLIDWLLIDAPLQRLDGEGSHWRLRVTLNGDSFQVDRQEPLWLSGLRSGSNPLQLELLDGLGEPLNPPFNSLVQNLEMRPEAPRPWQTASISAEDLERLLGERPSEPAAEITLVPEPRTEPDLQGEGMATESAEAARPLGAVSAQLPLEEAATVPEAAEDNSSQEPEPVTLESVESMAPVDAPDSPEPLAAPESTEPPASAETPLGSTPQGEPSEEPSEELVAEPVVVPEAEASALERLRARFGG
ncbi:Proline-rich region [Synechococcus sp. WH 5701]|nr:Proline-rich region [Synechococcus sp. WH 5701]